MDGDKILLLFLVFLKISRSSYACENYTVNCQKTLKKGQFMCPDPKVDYMDTETQQPKGCRKDNTAPVQCIAAKCIICEETNSSSFIGEMPCQWTNGCRFDTALLLSIFLGMFGIDRFYLGYPAIGLLKFSTLGFLFIGQVIDIVLIATQTIGPADGSYYIIPYYGPKLNIVRSNNGTSRIPQLSYYYYRRYIDET